MYVPSVKHGNKRWRIRPLVRLAVGGETETVRARTELTIQFGDNN